MKYQVTTRSHHNGFWVGEVHSIETEQACSGYPEYQYTALIHTTEPCPTGDLALNLARAYAAETLNARIVETWESAE